MKTLLLKLLTVILVLSLILTGCTTNNNNTTTTTSTESPTPTPDSKVLKLLYWQAPTILNPHLSSGYKDLEASRLSLEPLASYNQDGKMVLFLAKEEPEISEGGGVAKDGLSVIWKLKEEVKWSDGQPFTADDVVFTYKFISNKEVASTTLGNYQVIKDVVALDKYRVKINFKNITPGWNQFFVGTEGLILPKHIFDKYNGVNARSAPGNLKPVGTGPYRVVEFKPGDAVVYEKNPFYREKNKPFFDRVELKGGGDATSAARAVFQTGEADFANNLQIEASVLKQLKENSKAKLISQFGPLMERVIINFSDPNNDNPERSSVKNPHPFFSDIKVRQALSLAIDRDVIANEIYGDTGKVTANFLVAPPDYVSNNNKYQFNLDKAAKLLDEAGIKDTNGDNVRDKGGKPFKILFQTSVNPVRQKSQEIVKQSLKTLGIEVELKAVEAGVFFSGDPANTETNSHFTADLQMYSTGNTNPDPTTYMSSYTCSQIPQKANNWSLDNVARYCNKEYDKLWEEASQELDPEKRIELFIKMNDLLIKEAAVIPLVHRAETAGVSGGIKGVELTPWDLKTWNIQDWTR